MKPVGQLDLEGNEITGLTERQQRAFDFVRAHGPCQDVEVGLAHHLATKGVDVHGETYCKWCGDTGASVLEELQRKGLVEKRGAMWVLSEPGAQHASNHSPAAGRSNRDGVGEVDAQASAPSGSESPYNPETGEGIPF